jgi:hypothetical protein
MTLAERFHEGFQQAIDTYPAQEWDDHTVIILARPYGLTTYERDYLEDGHPALKLTFRDGSTEVLPQ